MATSTIQQLLTAETIAEMLGISKRQVWRMASGGQLPRRVKLGRLTRWRRDDVQRWIDAGCPKRSYSS
jgi:excisionase family DNA binding protein